MRFWTCLEYLSISNIRLLCRWSSSLFSFSLSLRLKVSINMFKLFLLFCCYLTSINGHGYLFEPIARSSAWLVDPDFKACCSYESHMEMFCGGVGHQWNSNGCSRKKTSFFLWCSFSSFLSGGQCGICGEPYDRAIKLFEKGGAKYLGKIVQTYNQGQQIDVQIKVNDNHRKKKETRTVPFL